MATINRLARSLVLANRANAERALGVYNQWAVCADDDLMAWFRADFLYAKVALREHDIQLVRGSALTFDAQDRNVFLLRRL